MTRPAAIERITPWTVLPGPIAGLTQPTLFATLRCGPELAAAVRRLEAILSPLVDEERDLAPAATRASPDDDAVIACAALADWAGRLQRHARIAVSRRHFLERDPGCATASGDVLAFLPYADAAVARTVFDWLIAAACVEASGARFDPQAASPSWGELEAGMLKRAPPGLNGFRFLMAADERALPVAAVSGGVFRFGLGRRSRLIESSFIDTTSAIGVRLARSKSATARVLREAGLPAPTQSLAGDEKAAVAAARRLGYPVVVKPDDLDGGVGVSAGLVSDAEVASAFARARAHSSKVIVEAHADGDDHRLLVVQGAVVQAFRREPASVTGDGRATLAALVAAATATPVAQRRGRDMAMVPLALDEEALELARAQGIEANDVVPEGAVIRLRRKANVSAGGSLNHLDLAAIHPDNLALARRAARALRLDPAGVDLITPDIARSWLEGAAVICEVNACPQISGSGPAGLHGRLLDQLLGPGRDPVLWACLCDTMPTGIAQWTLPGASLGIAGAAGVWLDGEQIARPFASPFDAARCLLSIVDLDVAIVQIRPQDLLQRGLACARWDGALVAADAGEAVEAARRLAPNVLHDWIVTAAAATRMAGFVSHLACEIAQDPWPALRRRIESVVGRTKPGDLVG